MILFIRFFLKKKSEYIAIIDISRMIDTSLPER